MKYKDIELESELLIIATDLHWKQEDHINDPDCQRCADLRQAITNLRQHVSGRFVITSTIIAAIRHPIGFIRFQRMKHTSLRKGSGNE